MSDHWMTWGLAAAAVATGLVAGVFMTFSDFVMRSLNAARPAAGMEAMQQINRMVYGSFFLFLFMALAPLSAAIAIYAAGFLSGALSAWLTAGGLLYVLGVFGVTVVRNVPMNKRLDRIDTGRDGADGYWPTYVRDWTWWNHVRSFASFGAASCYLVGAVLMGQAT
jgi:uncharacterized membrane protein